MAFEFKLPDIGEGVVEGEIVKWLVQPGDAIAVDEPMVEVMTDKATVVIPSPVAGTVRETRGAEGDTVEVHSVLVVIDTDGAPKAAAAEAPKAAAPKPAAAASGGLAAAGPSMAVAQAAPAPASAASTALNGHAHGAVNGAVASAAPTGGKALAAPATRRLARELGVDLGAIAGTGPAGRVTSDDVRRAHSNGGGGAAVAAPAAARGPAPSLPAVPAVPSGGGEAVATRIPVRGLRKRIWDNMAASAFTAAHFTFVEECDCTDLVALRAKLNGRLHEGEAKLTYLPFIIKAVVAALKRFPALNGHVDDGQLEFVERRDYHIGIAVASERGLIVPVIRNADRRSLIDLASEIQRLSSAVRDGSLKSEDLGGSTFTITSLGKEGGIFATPIINYPEVAIMGVHKMAKRPMVVEDAIAVRDMMNLSLSFDHRLIDGHVGAAFTYAVIGLLQSPERLVMEMG